MALPKVRGNTNTILKATYSGGENLWFIFAIARQSGAELSRSVNSVTQLDWNSRNSIAELRQMDQNSFEPA